MSQTVDSRVVELGFNNKQFEMGTKESLRSLEAMKKGLNFEESSKSIANLSKASKGFSLTGMAEGVQGISNRFSALGIMGMTVISNLTNAAINYGKKLVSSIMEPMKTGFQEYETQMNAIQTVLANTESKGTTLEDVNAALNELNTYADKTIYNFTEMTRNIGTFTAAGVGLETSTQAIKGIANLAAVSGSNSQQASTAMYQLSQALSSGTVKLMDWNSVVNAGMGGQVFQDALKETARVSGIAIDDLIDKHGSFRETLSEGWLSSEVLLDTLQKFTGDLNAEQLKTMGYNEEQIEGILKLGQTANDAATKVKTFTQLQDTLKEAMQSGWTQTWQIIIGDFEEAKSLFTEISDTLGAMIGESAESRNSLLENWKYLGGRTALVESLRNAFQALMSIITPIKKAFQDIFPPMTAQKLYKLTLLLQGLTARFILSAKQADQLKRTFKGVFSIFAIGIDAIKAVATGIAGFIDTLRKASSFGKGDGLLAYLANLGDKIVAFRETLDFSKLSKNIEQGLLLITAKILQFSIKVRNIAETVSQKVGEIMVKISQFIEEVKAKFAQLKVDMQPAKEAFISFGEGIKSALQKAKEQISALFSGSKKEATDGANALDPVVEKFKGIGEKIKEAFGEISKSFDEVKKAFPEVLSGMGEGIQEFFNTLLGNLTKNLSFSDIFTGINAGLLAAMLLSLKKFLSSGSGLMDEIGGVFGGITGILDGVRGSLEAWQSNLKAKTLLTIAGAIAIIAAALIALSFVDPEKLTVSLGVITGLFANLMGSMAVFSKFGTGGMAQAASLVVIALAILVLAGAMAKLAEIDEGAMSRSLQTLFALLAGLATFAIVISKSKGSVEKGSLGLLAFAYSLLTLVEVIRLLGKMKVEELRQGLIALGILIVEVAIFTRLLGKPEKMIATSVGLLALAGVMLILQKVVEKYGQMDMDVMAQGLQGMGIALLLVVAAMRLMPKNVLMSAVSLVLVAGALYAIGEVIKSLGNMSWEEVGRGLATIAGALIILAIGLTAMSGSLFGSAALLVAAVALSVLVPVLQTLGQMPLSQIGIALLGLAGAFAVLGVAGLLLAPLVPVLLALGAIFLLLGVGLGLMGVGLGIFMTGLMAIAAGGAVAATAIVAFVTILLGLVPIMVQTLINAIIQFAKGVQRAAPEVQKAITAVMLGFLGVIQDTAPEIFKTLDMLLKDLIQLIRDNIPLFIEAMLELLLTLLQEIAAKMPDFIQAGFDILISFLKGIRDNIADVVTVVVEIVTEFLGAVADNLPDIIQSGFDLIIAFMDGMSDAIDNNTDTLLAAVARLAGSIIDGLVTGIGNGVTAVINAIKELVRRAIAAAWAAFDSESPSKEMIKVAETVPDGIVAGLKKYGYRAVRGMTKFGGEVVDAMGRVKDAASTLIDGDISLDPVITPVVDMSNVEAAGDLVNSLFGQQALYLDPALSNISSIARGLNPAVVPTDRPIPSEGTNIVFNQTNTSPKALSEIEIYRMTRNQLRQVKGIVS